VGLGSAEHSTWDAREKFREEDEGNGQQAKKKSSSRCSFFSGFRSKVTSSFLQQSFS
jgi:hypothetical protein